MRDVLTFGGRIVIRRFDDVRDLMTLSERIIVNCTGLGARALFGDEELVPIKGQLTMLVPQPDVTYVLASMMPRSDGIALGSTNERGVWTLEIDEEVQRRVVEEHRKIFDSMRGPIARVPVARAGAPVIAPPVESFFGRES
jgi:D-amino-acid oxidase